MNKFEKFDKPIKDYDGFIDRDGYFYKVKKTDSKEADGHYNWAVAYINTFLDNVSNNLLDIRELIKKSDPVEYLINYLGFIYYNHNPEYGTPLVQGPNPRYGGKKATREQLNMLMNLMVANNENPFDNSLMNYDTGDLFINKTIR